MNALEGERLEQELTKALSRERADNRARRPIANPNDYGPGDWGRVIDAYEAYETALVRIAEDVARRSE